MTPIDRVGLCFYFNYLTGGGRLIAIAINGPESFPLDRTGRLGGIVVDDAVDAFDFVDDARRDPA